MERGYKWKRTESRMERLETPLCIGHGVEDWKKPEQQKTEEGWDRSERGDFQKEGLGRVEMLC